MPAPESIFLDFRLPNATTWFYFSFLLAVALFFKFSRLLSVRNWDILTLFLLVPGLLLLQQARPNPAHPEKHPATAVVTLLGTAAGAGGPAPPRPLFLGGPPALPAGTAPRTGAVGKQSAPLELAERSLELNFWVKRGFAVFCHLLVVSGLIFIGCRHFGDALSGMAAATFYLMLPYTGLHVGQAHHVWPVALIVWALATYKLPIISGTFLGLAAGTMYFPAVLLPTWFSFYWKRGAGRFLSAFLL